MQYAVCSISSRAPHAPPAPTCPDQPRPALTNGPQYWLFLTSCNIYSEIKLNESGLFIMVLETQYIDSSQLRLKDPFFPVVRWEKRARATILCTDLCEKRLERLYCPLLCTRHKTSRIRPKEAGENWIGRLPTGWPLCPERTPFFPSP